MAVLNQIQDRSQISRVLQGRFNITGDAPSPALAPEVFPTLVYENDRPEWRFFKGEAYFSEMLTGVATAGERGCVWFTLPVLAPYVAVIEEVWVSSGSVDVGWGAQPTWGPAATIGQLMTRDNRFGDSGVIQYQSGSATAANAPYSTGRFDRIFATAINGVRYPIILGRVTTARGILFRGTADNTSFNLIVRGYYRALLPNEIVG